MAHLRHTRKIKLQLNMKLMLRGKRLKKLKTRGVTKSSLGKFYENIFYEIFLKDRFLF